MKNQLNMLALDLGSSNGRGMLGKFDGEKISIEEIHRFENGIISMSGMVYWDILRIHAQIKQAFVQYKLLGEGALASFGIDAWGNDCGLVDKNNQLLSNARSARHTVPADMEAAHKVVPGIEIFRKTGMASYSIHTLYQLYRRIREGDPAIENAASMFMIPDLMAFFCTGERHSEYTISTSSMMYNPLEKDWARDILSKLRIPTGILPPVVPAGTLCGSLLPEIVDETGVGRVPCALVGSHDTASAVAAVPALPGEENYAFCSSGTWSMVGMETDEPILADEMYSHSFSNEGTVQGGFRPLKNITGLWVLQECRKQWRREGMEFTYGEIDEAIENAAPLRSFIDLDHSDFFGVSSLLTQIKSYCKRTGQPVPETVGEVSRCVYESLVLKYRWTMEFLDRVKGTKLDKLYIVGGGARSRVLNQMSADCTGRQVVAGPIEGAAMGNLLTQAIALGEISGITELRQVVRQSSPLEEYAPRNTAQWDEAYGRFLEIIEKEKRCAVN